MQVFKCKMCGGTLNIENGTTVAECEFCGRKQTIPKLDDEKRANLYDRANHFRRNNDYDKAMGIYEIILNEDKTDAEAYWSILLCKYGVEYVEDPTTHKRVPTINRTQFTSITKDVDYKNALKYADGYQRDIYQEEAKEIDKIQKSILAISGKEEPFDIFICYKETDHSGRRTIDSVLAQELYYNLKNEGFKVFFSRITLEDKLGVAYEPYIFAALNSAKVMIVIGSKTEYFNAVWVKNEWSRYLSLIRKGEKKTLIPAYKDIDPYDLPEEFSHLQAQDMNKLGFMQDLVYGIKKIIGRTNPSTIVKETVVVDNHQDTAPLLRRAYLFLEDGDFDSAEEYTEKVLDANPECAEAYFIKLLIELGLRKPELLTKSETVISESSNYKKALRFADKKFGEKLVEYNNSILSNIENRRKENIYQSACEALTDSRYLEAINEFAKIVNYKDSAEKIELCKASIEKERKDRIYKNALARLKTINVNDIILKQSISDLQSIIDYKDSKQKIAELQASLEKYYYDKKVAEEKAKIRAEEERLQKLREAELRKINAEKRKQKIKKAARIGIPSILAITLVLVLTFTLFIPTGKYNKANDLLNAGKYEEAMSIYEELDGFGGSVGKIATINAVQTITDGSIEKGIRDALNAGIKVNLTYEFNGGQFAQDVTRNTIRLSSPSTANETESPKTYTFTKVSDFTGFIFSKRNGYDFIKWALVSCSATVTSNDNVVNVRLTATWKAKEYSITYELNGGSLDGENPIGYNPDEPFTLTNPTKKGYTFLGWTGTDLTSENLNVSVHKGSYGDREYTANWQANTYVVTYDANGGTSSQTQDIATYDKEFVLTKAERKGYTFLGWFYGAIKCEDFDKWELTNGLSLVAKWQAISYTITYNLNGGNATNILTYTIEDSINISTPTKKGYSFDGWTGTDLTGKTQNVCLPKGTTGDKTFNANWTANDYTLSFDVNGGDELVNKSKNVTYDETYSLPVPTRIGYDFIKWETNTGTVYSGGTWKTANNVTLIAQWKAKEYTVTYNGNGGTPISNDVTVAYDSDFIPTTANRTGYDFVCWKYNGVEFSGGKWELTTNITLIAEWSPKTYTIIYVGNGGTPSTNSQTVTYDTNPMLATAERTGYTFKGWYNGSTKYTSGNQWETANNIILTAEWTANTNTPYTVKHYQQNVNDNGYTLFDTQGFTGTSDASITPAVMTYTGFTSPSTQATTISPDGSKIIEYYYTRNSYTLTLVTNGGTGSSITQKYQSNLDKENWSTRNGFTFGGWFIDKDLTTVFGFDDMPAQSQTIYAWWTEENKPTDFTYIEDSGITISSYLGNSTTVRIPAYIGGLKVKTIGVSSFANKTIIEEIYLPQTITNIEAYAFSGCTAINRFNSSNVNELIVPNGVNSIGSGAFSSLSLITKVIVSNSVTDIGNGAFDGCNAIEEITLPFVGASATANYYDAVFGHIFGHTTRSYSSSFVYVFSPAGKYLGYATSTDCSQEMINKRISDSDLIMYESVGSVWQYSCNTTQTGSSSYSLTSYFYFIPTSIREVTITQQKAIPVAAFNGCYFIESITIPTDATSVGAYAFQNCSSLNQFNSTTKGGFNIPDSVEMLGESSFDGCIEIENLEIPFVGENASSTENIKYVFGTCADNIKQVTITNDIDIPALAFSGLTNLENVTISKTVKEIGVKAFYSCTNLSSVIYEKESSLTTIGASAFEYCKTLTSIEIPINVTSIGNLAFAHCTALKEIKYNAINCSGFNSSYSTYCIAFTGSGNATDGITVIIGNLVKNVPGYIFYTPGSEEVSYITTVIFEKGSVCESIGHYAFYGCKNLSSIEIPQSVVSIGNSSFENCYGLTQMTFEERSSLTTIGSCAFSSCNFTTFIIPNGTKTIKDQVFYNCNDLERILIPSSVTKIGVNAFEYCSSLSIIFYKGDANTFKQIELTGSVNSGNSGWSRAKKYFYCEDTPRLNEEGTAYDGNYWCYVGGVPTIWVYSSEEQVIIS